MLREAEKIGPATIAQFEAIMKAKPHPEQGFRSCRGILSLVGFGRHTWDSLGGRARSGSMSMPTTCMKHGLPLHYHG
jgi:hypothetical protein